MREFKGLISEVSRFITCDMHFAATRAKFVFQAFLWGDEDVFEVVTLQGINISHLRKWKIIFKMQFFC